MWFRADFRTATGEAIRHEASKHRVPVDAWVAVMLEYRLTLDGLDQERSQTRTRSLVDAAVAAAPTTLAFEPADRAWQATLAGKSAPGRDELPELVLPRRLLQRAGSRLDGDALLAHADDWPIAKACESLACASGQTLEGLVRDLVTQ